MIYLPEQLQCKKQPICLREDFMYFQSATDYNRKKLNKSMPKHPHENNRRNHQNYHSFQLDNSGYQFNKKTTTNLPDNKNNRCL